MGMVCPYYWTDFNYSLKICLQVQVIGIADILLFIIVSIPIVAFPVSPSGGESIPGVDFTLGFSS